MDFFTDRQASPSSLFLLERLTPDKMRDDFQLWFPKTEADVTFMDRICGQLFKNETDLSDRQQICVLWFQGALEQCTTTQFIPDLLDQMYLKLQEVFNKASTYLLSTPFDMGQASDPRQLSETFCNFLLADSVRDYIEIAPKYSDLEVQNSLLKVGFWGLFAYFVATQLKLVSGVDWWQTGRNLWKAVMPSEPKPVEVTESLEQFKNETSHLSNASEKPTVVIKVPAKQRSTFHGLVDDHEHNVDKVIQKIQYLFQTGTRCRIMIDLETDGGDLFVDALTEIPESPQASSIALHFSKSVEMIENIEEPQEMLDGKISSMHVPIVNAVAMPDKPVHKRRALPRPISRPTKTTVWKPRPDTTGASFIAKARHNLWKN